MIEKLSNYSKETVGGFSNPTVLIESQSAPALFGDPIEQAYMRGFVLAGGNDLVVTDLPLNEDYIYSYLRDTLGFSLPKFLITENHGLGCLSANLIKNDDDKELIKQWAQTRNGQAQIQFFNITQTEKKLQEDLGLPSTAGNIEAVRQIGSKSGFRRFCEANAISIPRGVICDDLATTISAVLEFFSNGKKVLIKAEDGTGGASLGSNVVLDADECLRGDLPNYVNRKMAPIQNVIGKEWVVEEEIEGIDGSVHVYIKDGRYVSEPLVFGQLIENTSYNGGYWPFTPDIHTLRMTETVKSKIVPLFQQNEIYGYHCFDFRGDSFLEDNARPGALDFVHGFTRKIANNFFPNKRYAYWHSHLPITKPISFSEIWNSSFRQFLIPSIADGSFATITNQEVLPFGRSLDLTAINLGAKSSVGQALDYFNFLKHMFYSIF